ncbi:hypothetical protein KSP40_PGU005194 [Platanthera guangdongensis]|uniref:PHD-type domain-containing protein n=1 Tax=Platanthera guangdongensis TaxID=2320717 RepID=A0ABR2MYG6_9ASPA
MACLTNQPDTISGRTNLYNISNSCLIEAILNRPAEKGKTRRFEARGRRTTAPVCNPVVLLFLSSFGVKNGIFRRRSSPFCPPATCGHHSDFSAPIFPFALRVRLFSSILVLSSVTENVKGKLKKVRKKFEKKENTPKNRKSRRNPNNNARPEFTGCRRGTTSRRSDLIPSSPRTPLLLPFFHGQSLAAAMSGGRSKRRKTTDADAAAAAEGGSSVSEKPLSPSRTSGDGVMAAPSVAPGLDLYAQARKALTERCPFDSEETAPRFGTLPSALAVNFHKKSDGRRKHRKVQEGAEGKSVGPGRPPPAFSVWEKTEEYFRAITLDDIDLLFTRLPPDSCFYLPGSENLVEEVVKGEAVLDETAPGEVFVASSSVVIEEGLENVGAETVQPMHVDEVAGCSTAFPAEDPETNDQKSLNWILGCKQRFLLTSWQISRKKKLFGKDAGLEPLFLLPRTEAAEDAAPPCDFCCSGLSDMKSILLVCDSCKVSVHQKCYGVHEVPDGGWLCSWCKYLEAVGREIERNLDEDSSFRPCLLCPQTSGALKPVVGNFKGSEESKFVHLFCSLWTPGMYVENVGVMEPVIQNFQEPQRRLTCNLCKIKHGISVRCSHGMHLFGLVELRIFCLKHSSRHNIDSTASAELPSRRLPKIKITSKSKDNSMVRDGNVGSLSDGGMNSDTNLNKQKLVLELGTSGGDAQSNKTQGVVVPDNENALRSTSDVITILRKIIDRRKISIGDVALELGGEGASLPSELRLKIIQWLQNFAHVQPPTCHLKSRNGDVISSSSLIARVSRPSASTFNGRIDQDSSEFREVADIPLVKSHTSCSNKNNSHDLMHDSTFYSSGDAFDQDNSNLKFVTEVDVPSDCINAMVTDNDGIVSGNIEDHHLTELNVADTVL